MKKESKETAEDELEESPAKQKKELETGSEGVELPEDFQKQVHSMIKEHGHSKPRLEHIRSKTSDGLDQLREAEIKSKGLKTPSKYSLDSAPEM